MAKRSDHVNQITIDDEAYNRFHSFSAKSKYNLKNQQLLTFIMDLADKELFRQNQLRNKGKFAKGVR